jgi:hypothetical protein
MKGKGGNDDTAPHHRPIRRAAGPGPAAPGRCPPGGRGPGDGPIRQGPYTLVGGFWGGPRGLSSRAAYLPIVLRRFP